MSGDNIARAIAATSAAIALSSFAWTVTSWRLAGPALRFHCIMYGQVLIIRVFNAGRIADTVEQMELGSRDRTTLTELLRLPLRVEPGQSKQWEIGIDHLPDSRVEALRTGWTSVWILTGSMQQRRAEVLPAAQDKPPASGWSLVPRRVKLYRFVPLGSGLLAMLASSPDTPHIAFTSFVILLAGSSYWLLRRILGSKAMRFTRRRVERFTALSGVAVGIFGYAGVSSSGVSEPSIVIQCAWTVCTVLGVYLAIPRVGDVWAEAAVWTKRQKLKIRRQVAGSDPREPDAVAAPADQTGGSPDPEPGT